jgi:hypothetical protein
MTLITFLFIVHIYNYYLYRAMDPDKEWSELMGGEQNTGSGGSHHQR